MIKLLAPAKINFGLRVTGRRPDGYHELASLFLPLDLADELWLGVAPADCASVTLRVRPTVPGVPENADNLAARAARAFLDAAGLSYRVDLVLTKNTPVAAGLGGGSSDAAAVLRGLADQFPDAMGESALAALALSLGADVPFFLDPSPCWVRGVGEDRGPLSGMPPLALLLANPGVELATAEVFRAFDALNADRPSLEPMRPEGALFGDPRHSAAELARFAENDLEAPALRLCPAIGRLRGQLQDLGALVVGLSGSGATVFGVFEHPSAAADALGKAAFDPPIWGRVAMTRESR